MHQAQFRSLPHSSHPLLAALVALVVVSGCVTPTASTSTASTPAASNLSSRAVLLVSLNDGSIIEQEIDANADICMKVNESSLTTCLKRGAPLLDDAAGSIVGYRMVQTEIHLLPE